MSCFKFLGPNQTSLALTAFFSFFGFIDKCWTKHFTWPSREVSEKDYLWNELSSISMFRYLQNTLEWQYRCWNLEEETQIPRCSWDGTQGKNRSVEIRAHELAWACARLCPATLFPRFLPVFWLCFTRILLNLWTTPHPSLLKWAQLLVCVLACINTY